MQSLENPDMDTVIYAVYFWRFSRWVVVRWVTDRHESMLYYLHGENDREKREVSLLCKIVLCSDPILDTSSPFIRCIIIPILQGKWSSVRLSHLPEVVEVGFGLRSDSRTLWSFYYGLIPPSCLLLPSPCMAELWLVLRGELNTKREAERTLNSWRHEQQHHGYKDQWKVTTR